MPLFHVNGVLVTGLLPVSRGAHVVLGPPQGYRGEGVVARFWEMVEYHRINFFSGVPTLYASLLQVPVGGHRLDSLEYGLCGTAPMPVGVFQSFQECTGLNAFLKGQLSERAALPKHVRVIDRMPLTAVGKIFKPALKHREAQDARGEALREGGSSSASSVGRQRVGGRRTADPRTLRLSLYRHLRWAMAASSIPPEAEGRVEGGVPIPHALPRAADRTRRR